MLEEQKPPQKTDESGQRDPRLPSPRNKKLRNDADSLGAGFYSLLACSTRQDLSGLSKLNFFQEETTRECTVIGNKYCSCDTRLSYEMNMPGLCRRPIAN